MLYLNEKDLQILGIDWSTTIDTVQLAVDSLITGAYAQPLKPYLRYRDPQNRIIAMPAFVGGKIDSSGIKWIASFPENIHRGIPRAHSIVILNHPHDGVPICVINTPLLSAIRTASVSGLLLRYYLEARRPNGIGLGIIGWGPIGRMHFQMCDDLLGDRIAEVRLFDLRQITVDSLPENSRAKIIRCPSWEDVYFNSNVFITCTASKRRYIDKEPPQGSLLLNVSLRDYQPSIREYVNAIIVDNWEDVCRENTDIEMMHEQYDLQERDVCTFKDVVRGCIDAIDPKEPILFCPMGMAIFDIALAHYYYTKAKQGRIGTELS